MRAVPNDLLANDVRALVMSGLASAHGLALGRRGPSVARGGGAQGLPRTLIELRRCTLLRGNELYPSELADRAAWYLSWISYLIYLGAAATAFDG